jgi:undecaprenyl-diphosphatase
MSLGGSWREHARRLGGAVEPRMLATLAALAGCVWLFLGLADEIDEGETDSFDTRMLMLLRNPADPADPLGPGWIEEFGRDVTALGGIGVLTFVTLAAAGFLWLSGKRRSMLLLLVSVGGGQLLSTLFKRGFDRPRPDLVPHEALVYTASFPSGHAMMAAVTYLTLAAMLARVQPSRVLKAYILALAMIVTVAVGVSRVYLGVHWPTDVLAGWTAGAAWALACWTAARLLARRGAVESEGPAGAG